ncbi:uncharacterized protein [Clytia hemisphaerica]|uniref:uncharacterized protein n=1 Tax=Clytia hemisphaerica TaxID=252671 RepID=UPI0034D77E20
MLASVMKDHKTTFGTSLASELGQRTANIITYCQKYFVLVRNWAERLRTAGVHFDVICGAPNSWEEIVDNWVPGTQIGRALESLREAMKSGDHAAFRGRVYRKYEKANFAYHKIGSAKTYLNSIIVIPQIQDAIMQHKAALLGILSDPGCNAISQIVFDPDIIEISGGLYYKLSSRSLTSCPYKPTDKGRISPRIFKEVPDKVDKTGGVFADAVKNSFPDIKEQMEFIVKFYQCLLAFQLPQKTTKLALVGPKNSGKTSFVNVVRGLTHPEFIASLSKEKIFGMSMINSDTQFIFIDELSSEIMAGDQAKILLQGGPITVPRKHEEPEIVDNQAGIFVTCNAKPNYGDDQRNVEDRLNYMDTVPLAVTDTSAPEWILDHSFEILLWMVDQMKKYNCYVARKELFFVRDVTDYVQPKITLCLPQGDLMKLAGVRCEAQQQNAQNHDCNTSSSTNSSSERVTNDRPGCSKWHNDSPSSGSEGAITKRFERISKRRLTKKRRIEESSEDESEEEQPPKRQKPLAESIADKERKDHESLMKDVNETMNYLLTQLDYFSSSDGEQSIDFEATFIKTSRAHFVHKAEKNDKTIFRYVDINTPKYWAEMTRLIVKWFDRGTRLSFAHYNTFDDNFMRHGGLARRGAVPTIDAWFLVSGRVRNGFDILGYLDTFPWIEKELESIRRHLDIIVKRKLI